MCRFQLYQKTLAGKSPNYREDLIKTLRGCRHDNSLSRLEAARSTLFNLKTKLDHEQVPDLRAAIKQAIDQLEATPKLS
ncbi:MAG: hypothetical protein O7E52_30155 [Candidatus Poribacteria bacterium]|nr:hypothetical protein [Candidatus Poribacteria bacterium]